MPLDSSQPRASLSDYRWLVEGDGRNWLDRCQADETPDEQLARRLRRELSAERTHLLLEQRALRQRALPRFARAARLYFTRRALEQATDERLAGYKAARFPEGWPVVDLACGIGGDLMALAERGPALGIDLAPVLVCLANANLRQLGLTHGRAAVGDVQHISVVPEAAVHLDPDRRPGGRRSVSLDGCQPGPELIARLARHPAGLAVKLAPATDAADERLREAELEWLGHRRECQQLVAWFGPLAPRAGQRVATTFTADGTPQSLTASELPDLPCTATIGRFIVEPIPCVLAAGLAPVVAAQQKLASLTPRGGYLTGDRAVLSPWAGCFEVLEAMPFRAERLRGWLAERQVGRLEIKQRGTGMELGPLLKKLRTDGTEAATVILLRLGKKIVAVVTRRVAHPADGAPDVAERPPDEPQSQKL